MSERPTISPVIWYRDPRAAIAWLEQAFGFETRMVVDDGSGGVIHSELWIQDGYMMVVGPPSGHAISPAMFGGRSSQSTHVQLREGLDARCEQARAAGARIAQAPEDQFYGARTYRALDPEGHVWCFRQAVREVSMAEMEAASGLKLQPTS